MSSRAIKLMGLVFVMLLAVVMWPVIKAKVQPQTQEANVGQLTKTQADKIEVLTFSQGLTKVELTKVNGQWQIGGKKADKTKVEDVLAAVGDTTLQKVVARNVDNFGEFEVNETGIKLSWQAAGTNTTVWVGKNGTTFNTFYVRRDGEQVAYVATGQLRDKLNLTASYWEEQVQTPTPGEKQK